MSALKVKSLKHPIRFENNVYKIGCQTVSYEDMNEIADFHDEQKLEDEYYYERGQKFRKGKEYYILAQVENSAICLVSLKDGNRWTESVVVISTKEITENEFIDYGVGNLIEMYNKYGFKVKRLPITDQGICSVNEMNYLTDWLNA